LSSESISGASSTFIRRPFEELAVEFFVILKPSGIVPGSGVGDHGGSSSSLRCGGGPDCVPLVILRVLFVKVRDYFGIQVLRDLSMFKKKKITACLVATGYRLSGYH
jgi:hypothetical protein